LKYNVRFSPFAKEDKKNIKNYLSKFYPETPNRFITSLKEHIESLKDNPYIYPEYSENNSYRRMLVSNYIVFYKVDDAKKQIDIYRILRATWDLPKYL
jgi:toxin ParE1/3/4